MNAKLMMAGLVALAVAGAAGHEAIKRTAPAPGCGSGRCVWPVEEARKMTTQTARQTASVPRGRALAAALDATAARTTATATFALG